MPGKGSHGKDRLLAIDCLRGAAALFVFIFHVAVIANFPKRTLPPFTLCGAVLLPVAAGTGPPGAGSVGPGRLWMWPRTVFS